MAELKIKVLADLSRLKSDIAKLLKDKFQIDVGGKAAPGADKKSAKKSTKLLGVAATLLGGILAAVLAAKPFRDIVKVLINLIVFQILKLVKFIQGGALADLFRNVWTRIVEWVKNVWENIKSLPGRIWAFLKELPAKIWDFVKNLGAVIWEFLKELPFKIWELMKLGFDILKEKFTEFKDFLGEKLVELKDKFVEKLVELKNKFVDKVVELRDKFIAKLVELKDKLLEFKDKLIASIKELPQKIWDKVKELANLIGAKIKSALSKIKLFGGKAAPSPPGETDFIMRPGQPPVSFSPNDTIVGTEGGLPGGGGGNVFNFNGIGMEQAMEMIKRELATDQIRSSRF